MTKKILVCAYFARNFGDDLFLKMLFDRYPNVHWDLLTANRNYNTIFKDYKNVKIIYTYREFRWKDRPINLFFTLNDRLLNFKKYDAMVHIGGSIFMQSPAWKQKLHERQYLLTNFKKMNKKVYIIGANFGPYYDEDFKNSYEKILSQYDDICFRDWYSYNLFKHLDNVRISPDIVFGLKEHNSVEKEDSIGFSIINLEKREGLKDYNIPYKEKLNQLIEKVREIGYKVKLFSFCENEGDLDTVNEIRNKLEINDKNDVKVINYEGNINEFLHEFKSCKAIIGARFHSVILGLLFDQNIYPIIYSDKTLNVLQDLGMDRHYCHIREMCNLDVDKVVKDTLHNHLKDRDLLSQAEKQFQKLDLLLKQEVAVF